MKKYHMQIRYDADGWVDRYPHERHVEIPLLPWTNIECAPTFEEMKLKIPKIENQQKELLLKQWIRMIADDGECFTVGLNIVNNHPHRINHLHKLYLGEVNHE